MMAKLMRILQIFTLACLLASCAAQRSHNKGLNLLAQGKTEEGLASLEKAVRKAPDNVQYSATLLNKRAEQIQRLLGAAENERAHGKWDEAETLYLRVQKIEPANSRAATGLMSLARERRHVLAVEEAKGLFKKDEMERALVLLKPVLAENPSHAEAMALMRQIEGRQTQEKIIEPLLQTGSKKPVNLEFRDANLKIVLEALARTTGVNFILDKDVRPDLRTTLFLRQATLEDAIELILQTNRLEKKVLNRNTILIYPNSPEKLKEYQELVVKGFYLSNADVKQTQTMIKGLLKTKDVFIDEKLNLLVMRDSPDAIRLAEKLIAMHDLHEPEVMLEVEVLEVKRSRLLELGIQWPSQLMLTPAGAGASGSALTLANLNQLNSSRINASVSGAIVNFRHNVGDANILANPRIRARNREKAKIMIGDKVPVSTVTTSQSVVSESVQYLDVGIKLEVEPNIYLQDEVAIKVGLEVSAIANEVRTPSGSLAYQIGSRAASTVLRLKDGETQVLAGLINDEDRLAASRVPGLGSIPVVGRLFSTQKDDRNKTEIVLSITPRLIRNINRPDAAASEFWSGTETSLRTRPLTLQTVQASAGADAANTPKDGKTQPGPGPTAIALNWEGPSQVKAGEQFKVTLNMKADGGVHSLPLQIGFDPAVLQMTGIAEGAFFQQNDGKTSLSSNIDTTNGRALVSIVRSGEGGASGEGAVLTLTMRALAAAAKTELNILSVSPVAAGDKTVMPAMPAPFALTVGER